MCIPMNDFTYSLKNSRFHLEGKMGKCQERYFLRLDEGQHISCLQRHIKQECCNCQINPFSEMPYVKIRMTSQDCFLGNQPTVKSPGNFVYPLTFHSWLSQAYPEMDHRENSGGQEAKSELCVKAPLEFRHQSSCGACKTHSLCLGF